MAFFRALTASGGGGSISEISYTLNMQGANSNPTGFSFDVTDFSSAVLTYKGNSATYANVNCYYSLDGTNTSIPFTTTEQSVTIDLTGVSSFSIYGYITNSGSRTVTGKITFS